MVYEKKAFPLPPFSLLFLILFTNSLSRSILLDGIEGNINPTAFQNNLTARAKANKLEVKNPLVSKLNARMRKADSQKENR